MIDWGNVLAVAIDGAPAAAFTLLVVWLVWLVRRLIRGIGRAFGRKRPPGEASREPPAGVARRVEPTLEPVPAADPAPPEGVETRELVTQIQGLSRRLDELEKRVSPLPHARGEPTTPLRLVTADDPVPV